MTLSMYLSCTGTGGRSCLALRESRPLEARKVHGFCWWKVGCDEPRQRRKMDVRCTYFDLDDKDRPALINFAFWDVQTGAETRVVLLLVVLFDHSVQLVVRFAEPKPMPRSRRP